MLKNVQKKFMEKWIHLYANYRQLSQAYCQKIGSSINIQVFYILISTFEVVRWT